MRKLFVLFLLVALVPFTVGCNGLWDFDDDSDPVATTLVKLSRSFPAGAFTTRGATVPYVEDLTYVVDGITFAYASHTINDAGAIVVIFQAVMPTTSYNALQAKAAVGTTVATQLKLGTNVIATEAAATLPTTLPTTTTTDATLVTTAVAITVDLSGITDLVAPFSVTGVTFGGAAVSKVAGTYTNVNSQTPTFTVTFDAAPVDATTATFAVKVTNLATGVSYTLTTLTQGGLTVTPVAGQNAVTIAVAATNTINETLKTNTNYSIALVETNLKNAAATPLSLPGAYYIHTNF